MRIDFAEIATEQRQHLNLSDHAHSVMEADIAMFQPKLKPSGFVNHIIQMFWEISDASVETACERKRTELILDAKRAYHRKHFTKGKARRDFDPHECTLTDSQIEVIDYLVAEHREKLVAKMHSYPKGPALKIRLQNDVYDMLYRDPRNHFPELTNYSGNQGRYIKALMETYARLPLIEREAVFFRENYDKLFDEVAIAPQERRLLRITMKPSPYDGNISVYDMKPYDLMTDTGANYHYIVGMSRPAGKKETEPIPASIRLSRIDKVKPLSSSYASGKITALERKELVAKIAERGVPYLVGKTYEQKVELTPEGVRKYNRILHMRPTCDSRNIESKPNGNQVLPFQCSNTQISNYFLGFGADAVVLEPTDLAQTFKEHHAAAAEAYSD